MIKPETFFSRVLLVHILRMILLQIRKRVKHRLEAFALLLADNDMLVIILGDVAEFVSTERAEVDICPIFWLGGAENQL